MDDSFAETVPRWALRFAAGSAALAVLSFLFGGPGTELLTGALVAAFLVVSGYILYRSRREEGPPGGGSGGQEPTRRSETTAETGTNGYGGDGDL
jgi:4-amino-4-deoxy-L-arabinose transferase-like glycosyltransferase